MNWLEILSMLCRIKHLNFYLQNISLLFFVICTPPILSAYKSSIIIYSLKTIFFSFFPTKCSLPRVYFLLPFPFLNYNTRICNFLTDCFENEIVEFLPQRTHKSLRDAFCFLFSVIFFFSLPFWQIFSIIVFVSPMVGHNFIGVVLFLVLFRVVGSFCLFA